MLQSYAIGNEIDVDFQGARESHVAAFQTGWKNTADINSYGGYQDTIKVSQSGEQNDAYVNVQ